MLNGKVVLVTGGTGSFGKRFIRRVLNEFKPAKLIVYSRDELKQYEMSKAFPESRYPALRYFLGDVRDYLRVLQTFITDEERAVYFKKHKINGLDEIRPLMELRNKRYQEQARLDAAGKRTMGFTSIGDFLTRALPDDEWPFTVVDGKPIDFFTSLGLGAENLPEDGVECGWLSLD